MDRQLISEWFAYVPVLYWPVLCLEIVKFHLWAWADAETLGYARQMIVAVNDHGRIRVKFIEDAPAENWQLRLSDLSATASRLTAPSPFDLIEGPISDALSAHMKRLLRRSQTFGPIVMNAGPQRPILDPG
ncbi:MAG: hypothetical protein AAFW65_07745 [Pseudomonadota bacterium]